MNNRQFLIGTVCEKGKVKKSNQDGVLVKIGCKGKDEFGLFVVADGLGGLAHGEIASSMVVRECRAWWNDYLTVLFHDNPNYIDMEEINKEVTSLINTINQKIFDYARRLNVKIGSTLSILFIYENQYIIKHIGDSRIYVVNNQIKQLTKDHTWIAEQIERGALTVEAAEKHPKKHMLTRCLGVFQHIDIFEQVSTIHANDSFVVCSDGFYNHLDNNEIFQALHPNLLKKNKDVQDIVEKLFKKVLCRGARDNVSVIIIYQDYDKRVGVTGFLARLMSNIKFQRRWK